MKTIVKGITFYSCMTVIALFLAGGCETLWFYVPTVIAGVIVYALYNKYGEEGLREYSGVNYIKRKFVVDILSEE